MGFFEKIKLMIKENRDDELIAYKKEKTREFKKASIEAQFNKKLQDIKDGKEVTTGVQSFLSSIQKAAKKMDNYNYKTGFKKDESK